MFKRSLLEILRVFISAIWAIVGAIFWIPFLARMIAVFTVSVLLAVTKGNPMGSAENGLDAGVTFYIDGFKKLVAALIILSATSQVAKLKRTLIQNLTNQYLSSLVIQCSFGSLHYSRLVI